MFLVVWFPPPFHLTVWIKIKLIFIMTKFSVCTQGPSTMHDSSVCKGLHGSDVQSLTLHSKNGCRKVEELAYKLYNTLPHSHNFF